MSRIKIFLITLLLFVPSCSSFEAGSDLTIDENNINYSYSSESSDDSLLDSSNSLTRSEEIQFYIDNGYTFIGIYKDENFKELYSNSRPGLYGWGHAMEPSYLRWEKNPDDFVANKCDETILDAYVGKEKNVVVPDHFKILNFGCFSFTEVETVKLHDGIREIRRSAFAASNLKSIDIPSTVETIESDTFFGCYNLENIHLPSNLIEIKNAAFGYCTSLTTIELPNSLKQLGTQAFALSGLEQISIPSLITSISQFCFYECKSLKRVNFGSGVETISDAAFCGCGLDSVSIPNNVKTIEMDAFCESALTSISIGKNVSSIGTRAFGFCPNIKQITVDKDNPSYSSLDNSNLIFDKKNNQLLFCTIYSNIPENITKIPSYCFFGTDNVDEYTVPDQITTIEFHGFCNCSNIKKIYIGKNLKEIYSQSFLNLNKEVVFIVDSENPYFTSESIYNIVFNINN